jgi:hypothetical protein
MPKYSTSDCKQGVDIPAMAPHCSELWMQHGARTNQCDELRQNETNVILFSFSFQPSICPWLWKVELGARSLPGTASQENQEF